ncbi:hypothetical protein H105_06893 [Trichophyton soudanense CBS 452.61]|uniref:Uncharacterized protein n=1 Tax=Trichophyton soudanense CBS 452.61 TaxID=1215331 RepID=A0A022XKM9_TRISD|nr:hypothetical protein H105_06893 [Trichophyton soudanense CBS 452.61]
MQDGRWPSQDTSPSLCCCLHDGLVRYQGISLSCYFVGWTSRSGHISFPQTSVCLFQSILGHNMGSIQVLTSRPRLFPGFCPFSDFRLNRGHGWIDNNEIVALSLDSSA